MSRFLPIERAESGSLCDRHFIHARKTARILCPAACRWERVATTSIQASVAPDLSAWSRGPDPALLRTERPWHPAYRMLMGRDGHG